MEVATRALAIAAPDLIPSSSIRDDGEPPRVVAVETGTDLADQVVAVAREELQQVGAGNVSIIAPGALVDELAHALELAGVDFGRATRTGLQHQLTLVPVGLVKGLEVDAAIVVEPARIVGDEPQGYRSLYVALTRATQRLSIVHGESLPEFLRD